MQESSYSSLGYYFKEIKNFPPRRLGSPKCFFQKKTASVVSQAVRGILYLFDNNAEAPCNGGKLRPGVHPGLFQHILHMILYKRRCTSIFVTG